MSEADDNNRSQPADAGESYDESGSPLHAAGAPNGKDRSRGSREGDPAADSVMPGREFGAGGQVDDGPDETAGAGS
ncbi:hypothetical protein [Phenylobacterium deserti]|uniref:Uncharacterized protein n=1 Tax=Phenylobacterium deserti TaxID=1914756 RepID=A0A328AWX5_9CAUL|nr:hypothetical protein [Phenylobacterium deserti]RAK58084.1 hypothetical protein DJ018_09305 [Phenylobacterium deserti]